MRRAFAGYKIVNNKALKFSKNILDYISTEWKIEEKKITYSLQHIFAHNFLQRNEAKSIF